MDSAVAEAMKGDMSASINICMTHFCYTDWRTGVAPETISMLGLQDIRQCKQVQSYYSLLLRQRIVWAMVRASTSTTLGMPEVKHCIGQ